MHELLDLGGGHLGRAVVPDVYDLVVEVAAESRFAVVEVRHGVYPGDCFVDNDFQQLLHPFRLVEHVHGELFNAAQVPGQPGDADGPGSSRVHGVCQQE